MPVWEAAAGLREQRRQSGCSVPRGSMMWQCAVYPVTLQITMTPAPVNLSDAVYGATSIAAIGVAAHECGHAMQDAGEYVPLRLRAALVPVANFGAQISWPLILIGFFIGGGFLVDIGILLFSAAVLFQLVTLPVEYNASHRAVKLLDSIGILRDQEVGQARKVLGAAALTYVAAAAASILQLLRLLLLFGNRDRDN